MQVTGYIRILIACVFLGCALTEVFFSGRSAFARDNQAGTLDSQADNLARLIQTLENAESFVDNDPEHALSQTSKISEQVGPNTPIFVTVRLLAASSKALGRLGSNSEALERAEQALASLGPLNQAEPSLAKAKALEAYARANHNLGNLAAGLDYFYQAWDVYRDLDNSLGMAAMGVHRAIIYEEIGQADRAIDAYKSALTHAVDADNDFLRIRIINNLGFTYLRHGQPDKALSMLQDIRPLAVRLQNPLALAYVENNIGEALFLLGRLAESRLFLQKSLDQAKSLGISSLISGLLLNLGHVEEADGHLDKAMTHAQDGLAEAQKSNEPARIRDLLALKARLHHEMGNYREAFSDLKKSYHYRDEINSREVKHLAEVLGAQFSLDSKEQEIQLLHRDQEISALRLQREKTLRIAGLFGSLVLFALVIGLVMLLRSRTRATRQAEAKSIALLEVKEKLQKISQAKSNILAMTSHEVKTPLNGILGMAQILLNSDLSSEQRQQLETLYLSADTLLTLLNDILDLSRIEAGHVEIRAEAFDLHEMMNSLHVLWKTRAEDKGLPLIYHLDKSLPEKIIADSGRIRQILNNLISNAIKFTKQGDVKISVKQSIMEGGREFLLFTVDDDGIGISEDNKDDLFTPFFQILRQSEDQNTGTGLGLSICRELVTLMGGEIGFDNLPEKGTRFWFTLPLERAVKTKEIKKKNSGKGSSSLDLSSKSIGRILIAEDNEINQMVLREMLRSQPWELHFAYNGKQAVELVASGSFRLVLMDIHMPVMNGADAISAIRAMDGNIGKVPVIALSAYPLNDSSCELKSLQANDYLEKPIDRLELLAMIKRYMGTATDEMTVVTTRLAHPST